VICEILEMHGEGISPEAVDKIINDVDWLIKDRADVTPAAERTFSALLLDLSIALGKYSKPSLMPLTSYAGSLRAALGLFTVG